MIVMTIFALGCLLTGYNLWKAHLHKYQVFEKFLVVKIFIFLLILQQLLLTIISHTVNLQDRMGNYAFIGSDQAGMLESALIILELVPFSILLVIFFSPSKSQPLEDPNIDYIPVPQE